MTNWAVIADTHTGTTHVMPIDDAVLHTESEDCACGPTVEMIEGDGGDGNYWLVTHHSLDGREHDEVDHDRSTCPRCSP